MKLRDIPKNISLSTREMGISSAITNVIYSPDWPPPDCVVTTLHGKKKFKKLLFLGEKYFFNISVKAAEGYVKMME